LEQLTSCGIDWLLTEQGDLMIKYWQVGAEGFVPPERVAHIRLNHPASADITELEWVSQHLDELREQYAAQWIAVVGGQVVASAPSLDQLLQAVDAAGVQQPFVTQIPAGPVIWNMTYAAG
jgi:hypothetical protein